MPEVSYRTGSRVKPAPNEPLAAQKGYCWKRLRYSPPAPKDPHYVHYKRADWQMLKQWADEGLSRLLYLDESGFERTTPFTYSYVKRGKQHRIPKAHRQGRRISLLGLWQP